MAQIQFLPYSTTFKSLDENKGPSRFILTNKTDTSLKVSWISKDGEKKLYTEVKPGETYYQPSTNGGHAWEVANSTGTVSFQFLSSTDGEIQVTKAGPRFLSYEDGMVHTPLGEWSKWTGYGVIDVAKSLGIPDSASDLSLRTKSNNLALDLVNAPSAWAAGFTGKNVKVAILDTGIVAHPEITGKVIGGYDFVNHDTDTTPENIATSGHALAIAGLLAGKHDNKASGPDVRGIAPDVQLLDVKVVGANGSAAHQDLADGIRWAVDHGAQVLNVSLGSAGTNYSNIVYDALKYAYEHNVVAVISGGNNFTYGGTGLALTAKEGVAIDVGNYNLTDGIPFESSNLPGTKPYNWVMAASTGYLPATDGEYRFLEDGGTSYAAPYVSGLAAMLIQKYPNASAQFIIDKIIAGSALPSPLASASAGDDTLRSSIGDDVFDGLAGRDTVSYTGKRADFDIRHQGDKFFVTDKANVVVDTLSNVERISFSDGAVALDVGGNAGSLYRLYQAAFDRQPDLQGLGYWLAAMDGGRGLLSVANSFLASPEAQGIYGNLDPTKFLTQLYSNVLDRTPDNEGLNWHLNNIKNGVSLAQTLVGFSESGENIAKLVGVINNGIDYLPSA